MSEPDYLTGRTPFFACQADPRFSYCLYVPRTIRHVLVYVHGTHRDAAVYRDELSNFGEANHTLIVAPLFPAGLIDPLDVDNYKMLRFHEIRFDLILLEMLREIRARYGVTMRRFFLGGFSGGAQFAHRFSYFHGAHLLGLSIAAPGRVTLLDKRYDWWPGIHDVMAHIGQPIQQADLRDLPVQLVIGKQDRQDIRISPDSPQWIDGANLAGTDRRQRLGALCEQYLQLGADVSMVIVPDCAHAWLPLKPAIVSFFEGTIRDYQ